MGRSKEWQGGAGAWCGGMRNSWEGWGRMGKWKEGASGGVGEEVDLIEERGAESIRDIKK